MKVVADLCIVPIGVGVSLSRYIAAAIDELEAAGLEFRVHGYGTNVEGDYDVVFAALRRSLEKIHDMGAPRISVTVKLGTRIDRDQTIGDKIASVEARRAEK